MTPNTTGAASDTNGTTPERPSTPLQHDPSMKRPLITGPDNGPEPPFPVYLEGHVTRGFGRGSKELGCPTANLPDASIAPYVQTLNTGVYYGYARVLDPTAPSAFPAERTSATEAQQIATGSDTANEHDAVIPMVMSIGWNPFYKNERRTAEVHILHDYPSDFYGRELRVVILGFIRPEYNYAGLDALIEDINTDKRVALASVQREAYATYARDSFFFRPSVLPEVKRDEVERTGEKEAAEEAKTTV